MEGGRGVARGGGSSRANDAGRGGAAAEAELRYQRREVAAAKARAAALEAELLALRASAWNLVNSLNAGIEGDPLETRLLDVPNRVRELVTRGIRRGAFVGFAMAQAAGADLTGVDLEEMADAVVALVPVDAILNNAV